MKEGSFSRRVWVAVGITALVAVLLLVLTKVFSVLLLVLAGTLIAVYFRGLSLWLAEKTSMSEKLSLWAVIGGTVVTLVLVGWLLGAQIQSQISQLTDQLPQSAGQFREKISQYEWGRQLLNNSDQIQKKLSSKGGSILQQIGGFFTTTFGVLGDIYVIIFIGLFFTATPSQYKESVVALVPKQKREQGRKIMTRLGLTLRDWLVGKLFAMCVVAVLTWVGLAIIGVPMPLALALIAGLLNFIPNFGPLIAMIPAVLVSFSLGTNTVFVVIGLYVFIQVLESNFITPLVQKRLIEIPPAFIIISQVAMGVLTGGWGLILATPVVAVLMVLIKALYIEPVADNGVKDQ